MKVKDIVDSILVISLPERVDRRAALEKNWAAVGLNELDFTYIDGVKPQSETILWTEMRCMEAEGKTENLRNGYVVGAVGCKRAWKNSLEFFLASKDKTVLVCEDDCRWDTDVNKVLEEVGAPPEDWELLYFGAHHRLPPSPETEGWHRLQGSRLTTAIAFNRESAKRLLNDLKACPYEIDVHLEQTHRTWRAYCPKFLVARQGASKSDISTLQQVKQT